MYHALFKSEVISAKCSLTAESKNYNYHTPTHSLLFQGCKDSPRAIITINRKALKRSVHAQDVDLVIVTKSIHKTCYPIPFMPFVLCNVRQNVDIAVPPGNGTDRGSNATEALPPETDVTAVGDSESPTTSDDADSVDDSSSKTASSNVNDTLGSLEASPSNDNGNESVDASADAS
ncbi:uncharacterized protein LOC119171210 isoform X1 [Rhipicephalus microplus]|uniref:uncharacterized protein LOC119171210 isoform X1 n=1 Tax=Rhipicephalus microplus TaxID=6941 RepID=UPI003F6BF5E8